MSVVLRSGWELDNSNNSSVIFKAKIPQTLYGVPGGGTKQVEIVNNISTGNFDYYKLNLLGQRESQPFLSYNASNDIPTIKNLSVYEEFYDTQNGQKQFSTAIKSSKEATLDLAQLNAGTDPVSVRNYNTIKAKPGYASLGNAATAPAAQPPGAQPPLSPDPSADPNIGGGADPTSTVSTFQPDLGEGAALTAYSKDQEAISKNYSTLVYPRDHGNSPYDFIQIVPIEYVPGFGVGSIPPNLSVERVRSRFNSSGENQRYKQTGTQIFLPMTPEISESNSVGWGSDDLNPISALFGQTAYNTISTAGKGNLMGAMSELGNGLMSAGQQLLNTGSLSNFISAYFAGQAVNSNLLGRSGMVINPNLELLFQGPKLRSFRYNFRFTPRDADEAKIIRTIIKVFKKTMAVRQSPGSLFLGVPSVYELKYVYNSGGDHPFLNKIKPCALTSFNVNYTPDGSYMTYNPTKDGGGGSMTSYTVDMQFDEIEPIYNEDIDDIYGPTTGY